MGMSIDDVLNVAQDAAAYIPKMPYTHASPPVTEGMIIDLEAVQGNIKSDPAFTGLYASDRIYFKYTFDAFEENKSANYADINVIGRSEPILGYAGSGPRTFTIPLVFAAAEVGTHWEQVIRPVWLIRSWLYPDYATPRLPNVPPALLLVMGSWLSQRVVARSATIRYHGPWGRGNGVPGVFDSGTYDPLYGSTQGFDMPPGFKKAGSFWKDSMLPMWVEVTLVLQETMDNTKGTPYDTRYVRNGWDTGSGFF